MPHGAAGHQRCGAYAGHGSSHSARALDAVAGRGLGVRPLARAAGGTETDALSDAYGISLSGTVLYGTGDCGIGAYGTADESVRDLALAWVAMGGGNSSYAFSQATRLLEQAVVQSPEDPAILSALGYNEQRRKLIDKAREHYEHALRIDPLAGEAASRSGGD